MAKTSAITVDFNTAKINVRLAKSNKLAQSWLDNEILKDTARYVRRQQGDLERSGISGTVIGSGLIVYNEPYAHKKYYDFTHVSTQANPQACRMWFEVSKSINKNKWIRGVKKIGGI
jgi:hypothetical protein